MKKILLGLLAGMLTFGMCACSSTNENVGKDTVNPLVECSESDMTKKTGIDLPLPEKATNVQYFTLDDNISQVTFTYDGNEYTLRAKSTGETDIDKIEDISGMNYQWSINSNQKIQERDAKCHINEEEGTGMIEWLDVVPGIQYSLSVNKNATVENLTNVANTVFSPLQGEA